MAPKRKKNQKPNVSRQENSSGRRSSLRVNLSFVSNLSDSGNGSLRKSQRENREVRRLEGNESDRGKNALSNIVESTSSAACVEDAALSAIHKKEQALDQSCQLLKAAILNKTRQLFDRKAELAVKTTNVLKDQRRALKEINDDYKSTGVEDKSVLLKTSSMHSAISKNRSKTRSPKSTLRNNLPSVARISNKEASFILSSSNKSHRNFATPIALDKVLSVRLTRIAKPRSRTSSESSQATSNVSSIADDIGAPLKCSSFTSVGGKRSSSVSQRAESDSLGSSENSETEELIHHAEPLSSSLTPMEITAVQGTTPSTSRISLRSLRKLYQEPISSSSRSFTGLRRGNVTKQPQTTMEIEAIKEPDAPSSRRYTGLRSGNVTTQSQSSTESEAIQEPMAPSTRRFTGVRSGNITMQSRSSTESEAIQEPVASSRASFSGLRRGNVTTLSSSSTESEAIQEPAAASKGSLRGLRRGNVTMQSQTSTESESMKEPVASSRGRFRRPQRGNVTMQSQSSTESEAIQEPAVSSKGSLRGLRRGNVTMQSQTSTESESMKEPVASSRGRFGRPQRGNVTMQSQSSTESEAIHETVDASNRSFAGLRRGNVTEQSQTSMEIKAIKESTVSLSRSFTGLRRLGDVTTRSPTPTNLRYLEEVPMELTTVQSHIPVRDSPGSDKTTRTSMNVNTSAGELSRVSDKRSFRGAATLHGNDSTRVDRVAHVSLKVNTSLGTEVSPTQNIESNHNSMTGRSMINTTARQLIDRSRRGDKNSMDNLSLIARLRNLSSRKLTEPAESADNSKLEKTNRSSLGEGPSFVEGTPFPPSRSVLWKTQIRLNNATRNRTPRKTPPITPNPDSDESMSTEYLTPPNGTIVIDESPSRHTCIISNTIIQDSSEEDKSVPTEAANVTAPKENTTPNIQRSGKKKLLSLHHDLELVSLSPMSPAVLSPKKPFTWKPRKKLQKRKIVRAIAAERIEASREDCEEEDEDDELSRSFVRGIRPKKDKPKATKPRKVISKKIVVKKIAGLDILERLEGMGRSASDRESAAGSRSSLNEFTKKRRLTIPGRVLKAQKLVIVPTGFAKGDVDLIKSVVKDLGGAEISTAVSRRTTHVVSTGVRTINLLRGIIRGCWLVSLDWVLKSLENEKWLNAEPYEMIHFSKAVQENRRDRQLFGKAYVPELFTTCGPIYIEHGSTPPPAILKELVKTAGGRIAEDQSNGKLSVGPGGLREIWILDSITTGDLQPIKEYERK